MNSKNPTAILLAAGSSSRLGRPKQLLPWRGTTLLGYTLQQINLSNIENIILVLGANAETIENSLDLAKLRIVYNPAWETGKASSIQCGLNAIQEECSQMMFFLCDQPFLTSELINTVIQTANTTDAEIIAPTVGEVIINPVLFKKKTFSAFNSLKGDQGGKCLFDQFPMQLVNWRDDRILVDVDTCDDLKNLDHSSNSPLS